MNQLVPEQRYQKTHDAEQHDIGAIAQRAGLGDGLANTLSSSH